MKHILKKSFICAAVLAGYFSNPAKAQDMQGIPDSIFSNILKENRRIEVLLPKGYKTGSTEKYDVLYVTDGERCSKMTSQVAAFVEESQYMPPTIIVSIPNMYPEQREKDFLPSHVEDFPKSGGADDFLSFLANELIPYINKTYPSNGQNTLFGHSFGGVFALHALLSKPELFESYLIIDPAYWWDKGFMHKKVIDKFKNFPKTDKAIYTSGREGQGYGGMGIADMDWIFRAMAPENIHWKSVAYVNETHGSIKLKTVYDGLRFINQGFGKKDLMFYPMNGIVLKGKPFHIEHDGDSLVRFSTNGSIPLQSSGKLDSMISLDQSTKITAKSFFNREKYNKTATGNFTVGKTMRSMPMSKNIIPGGLSYAYYEGSWDKLPDFKKLKVVQSGIVTKDFNFRKFPSKTNFACLFNGFIEIQKDGYYTFGLASDDGSKFYLNNQLLIDNDGLRPADPAPPFIVPLEKGFYPIKIEYFQKGGGMDLELYYNTPDSNKFIRIPHEVQYSAKNTIK